MAVQRQLRRGTTTENNNFTGAQGELTYDTEKKQVRIHDGSTVGGMRIPTKVPVPDYSRGISVVSGSGTFSYVAPENGIMIGNMDNYAADVVVNGYIAVPKGNDQGNEGPWSIVVCQGDTIDSTATHRGVRFIPYKFVTINE